MAWNWLNNLWQDSWLQKAWNWLTEDRSQPDTIFKPGQKAGTLGNSAKLEADTFSNATPIGQYANAVTSGKHIHNINGNPITGVKEPVGLETLDTMPDLANIISNQVGSATELGKQPGTTADDIVKNLYAETGDNAWLEMLIQNQYARENTASARDWEKYMSDTAFSRQMEDIKNAGYNPWIAINSLSGATTPSVSASSVSNTSPSSQKTSKQNTETDLLSKIIQALISVALIGMIKK